MSITSSARSHRISRKLYAIGIALGIAVASNALAANLDCGQPISTGDSPTATDALLILNVAVGSGTCDLCVCDTDDSGATTATDALRTLNAAVGVPVELSCSACCPLSICDGLLAIDASANTLDRIEIGNVCGDHDELWAILSPSVGDDGVAPISLNSDGDEELIVPLFPGGGVDGGDVEVAVTNGTEVCPIGSLEILPLPAAPADTSANVLAAFLGLLDAIASDFGLTGEDLAITPIDELPSTLIPLALIQITLDGPTNENSLAAIFDGTAPALDDASDIDLLNRLLARTGVLDALEDRLTNRGALIPGPTSALNQELTQQVAQTGGCHLAGPVEFEIEDAEQLRDLMEIGQGERDDQSSLGDQVIADGIGSIFGAIGIVIGPARLAGSSLLYSWGLYEQWLGNLYPTRVTDLEFDCENDGRIPEDRLEAGDGGMAPLPTWGSPRLFAENQGIEVSRTVLEDLYEFLSFLPLRGVEDDPSAEATLESANAALEALGQDGCVSVPRTTWGPISGAFDPEFLEPLFFGASVLPGETFGTFEPVELGITQLRIRTTDVFSGPPASREKDINVVRKRITMQTPSVQVLAGDPVELIALITDSYRLEKFDWEYPAFLGTPVSTRISENEYKLSFVTPTEQERYPFEVKGFSTSTELPPAEPKREDIAVIRTEPRVEIEQPGQCIPNGETLDLSVKVMGLSITDDPRVVWSQFGAGDLEPDDDNTAVYTAPASGQGEVIITAELLTDSDVFDEISLSYGSCAINLDLGWHASSDTDDPDLPLSVDEMQSAYESVFPLPGLELQEPDPWWNGLSYEPSAAAGSTYLKRIFGEPSGIGEIAVSAASSIDAQLVSDNPGHASMSATWTVSSECSSVPITDNVYCSESTMKFDWNPVFWMEIEETGTYDARLTLSCTRNEGPGLFALGMFTELSRHIDRAAPRSSPNFRTNADDEIPEQNITRSNPFKAPAPTAPYPFGSPPFVCEPGQNIDIEATWELLEPSDPAESHLVALSVKLNSYMTSPLPFGDSDPTVGIYEQSGTITASVTVVKTSP